MTALLVTGASGFLGRHFVRELLTRDCDEVHGVDVRPTVVTPGRYFDRVRYRHHELDVRDLFGNGSHTEYDPHTEYDLVIHCAAVDPYRAAIDGANVNMSHNLEIDAAMFRWAVMTNQRHVLYVSSSAVYPIALQRDVGASPLLDEDFLVIDDVGSLSQPDRSYGWTKWIGEYQARQVRACGVPVTVVRPFSGYGEDQSENFPFRAFVERARRHENPFTIWGRDDQVRDFIHVSDVVRGALAAVAAEVTVTNLCTGVGTSMMRLANLCMGVAGYEADVQVDGNAPLGVTSRVGDPSRMLEFYEPKVTIEEGVRRAMQRGGDRT